MTKKVIIITLTKEQKKQLKPLYDQVEKATTAKEYGSIIAQVGLEYMEVCFLPKELTIPIIDLINNNYPEGFKKTKS